MVSEPTMKPTGPLELVSLFAVPGLLLAVATRVAIPFLAASTPLPREACWFVSAGLLVLAPLFIVAIWFTGREIGSFDPIRLARRMRIRRMGPADWAWTLGAVVVVAALTTVMLQLGRLIPGFDPKPEFFPNLPLQPATAWLIAVWLPFFFFNIFGEELWWRGYIQPRQELLTGKFTWLVHGLLWAGFHLGMGWSPIWLALPNFLILPLVVQIRKNTTIAIVIHAIFGALGFLSLALGLVNSI
jgi:membrane protease YdiL (CAAX protease family)